MKRMIAMTIIGFMVYVGCRKMAPEFEPESKGQTDCIPQIPNMDVTYDNYVKSVISRYCTESCHKGGNSLGPGNFTSYEGIKPYINDVFYFRVIQDQADMPQGNAPLPKAVRDSLNVWLENCGPKN